MLDKKEREMAWEALYLINRLINTPISELTYGYQKDIRRLLMDLLEDKGGDKP